MVQMSDNDEGGLTDLPAVATLRDFITACQTALAPLVPFVQAMGATLREYQALKDRWEQDAPTVLKDEISAQGLIVPVSQMSHPDLVELLELYRDRGGPAVVQRIKQLYDEIFDAADFLATLESGWTANQHLQRRLPLLQQALKAHALGLYGVSVPTLLAQFEGLIVDMMSHVGRMNYEQLKAHIATLVAPDSLTGGMLESFVNDALLAKFSHGLPVPPFSRHAVLHGGDVDYATELNSRTAILLLDHVSSLR